MKKFWKVLGTTALLASVIPYEVKKEGNKKTLTALLWSATDRRDENSGEKHKINISFKFNNPFKRTEESHLFADELTVDYCGPDRDHPDESPLDTVMDNVDKAVDNVEEIVKDAAEICKDAVEESVEKVKDIKEEITEEKETEQA